MAIIIRCDICGKTSEGRKTFFSGDPLVTTIPGRDGKRFRVSLFFEIADAEDFELQEQIASMSDEELYNFILHNGALHFKTPNPHVCEACKNYILHEWMINAHLENGFVFDSSAGDTMFIGADRTLKLLQNAKRATRRKKIKNNADADTLDDKTKRDARRAKRKERKQREAENTNNEAKNKDSESDDAAQT